MFRKDRRVTGIVVLAALASAACSGDDNNTQTQNTDAGTADAYVGDSAAIDGAAQPGVDAAGEASAAQCPTGLDCEAAQGVYLCEKPGPIAITCDAKTPCSFGSCYQLGGQGFCLQSCVPTTGYPDTTSVSGIVVQYTQGVGTSGVDNNFAEPVLAGVDVCVVSDAIKPALPCVKTDAKGQFTVPGLPPNRSLASSVGALVTFAKAGYVSGAVGISLGAAPQILGEKARLFQVADAQKIATALSTSLPDATHGWLQFFADRLNTANDTRFGAFVEGPLKLLTVDGYQVASAPAAGSGPYYAKADESFGTTAVGDAGASDGGPGDAGASDAAVADASVTDASVTDAAVADAAGGAVAGGVSSFAGSGLFVGVTPGSYALTFTHPTLNCGSAPTPSSVLPGYVTLLSGPLCGAK